MSSISTQDAVSEFYRQLGMLLRTQLPLPESVAGIAANCRRRSVRRVLEDVARELERGSSLSDALGGHERTFPAGHTALVRAAEASGRLADTLHDVAELSRRDRELAVRLKDVSAYPFVTILFAMTLVLALLRYYLPGFGVELRTMLERPLPAFSAAVFEVADVVVAWWPFVVSAYCVFLVLGFWFAFGGRSGRRRLPAIADVAPGTRRAAVDLDVARLSSACALMMERNAPLDRVLATAEGMALDATLRRQVATLRRQCADGVSLAEAARRCDGLPAGLRLALTHTPEARLPAELAALHDFYVDQADAAIRRATFTWQVVTFVAMACISGGAIIALFMPMIQLYQQMTGVFD